MKKYFIVSSLLATVPFLAQAQFRIDNATDVVHTADYFINAAVWILISLAVIFIVWNAVQFIRHAGGEDRKTYQNAILWGIVGLAVILSIWGLVYIVRDTFQTNDYGGNFDAQQSTQNLILRRPQSGGTSGGGLIRVNSSSFSAPSTRTASPSTGSSMQDLIDSGALNGD